MMSDENKKAEQRDLTDVLCDFLTEIRSLNARIGDLASAIEQMGNRPAPEFALEPEKPAPESWTKRAKTFVESADAEAFAAKHSLTIETVALAVGLNGETLSRGHRQYIGKILMEAGYNRVGGPGGTSDYRKLGKAS